ncbi:hypothetical protein QT882_18245, partial [Xanthomonas fragariae]|nr:hypothetical protein [Xanthomonas fragariae]MDM7559432.1 hypothetical protein [Xanthomonas fragariae]MDM7577119.1 hypothetical protein [Xanthomonas fragariae]MDM7580211.1 hypothetical protein [Xanthomonas fragariae]MDM7590407.1 hypothetical protein [Xanthomonas fragariae]
VILEHRAAVTDGTWRLKGIFQGRLINIGVIQSPFVVTNIIQFPDGSHFKVEWNWVLKDYSYVKGSAKDAPLGTLSLKTRPMSQEEPMACATMSTPTTENLWMPAREWLSTLVTSASGGKGLQLGRQTAAST